MTGFFYRVAIYLSIHIHATSMFQNNVYRRRRRKEGEEEEEEEEEEESLDYSVDLYNALAVGL